MIFDPVSKQISFACAEDEEVEVDAKEHYRELVEDATNMMKRIMKTPNENFPDFIWEPMQNDFSVDNIIDKHEYIDLGLGKIEIINGSEILHSVNKIKNRYKDYFDYKDALSIWYEYQDFVINVYGDFDTFAEMSENGLTKFPYKRKPKLKNAKQNAHLLEITVPISRIIDEDAISSDDFKLLVDEMEDQIEIYEDWFEEYEIIDRVNKSENQRLQAEYRVKNYRKTSMVTNPEFDAISRYINSSNNTDTTSMFNRSRSILEDIEAFHEYDGLPEDIKKDLMGLTIPKMTIDISNGIWVSRREEQETLDFYTELANNGYDIRSLSNTSATTRKAVKLISRQVYGEADMTTKEVKKMKKKRRKAEKHLYEAMMSNEKARQVLTKNRITFSGDNEISMTLKDILGGGN